MYPCPEALEATMFSGIVIYLGMELSAVIHVQSCKTTNNILYWHDLFAKGHNLPQKHSGSGHI